MCSTLWSSFPVTSALGTSRASSHTNAMSIFAFSHRKNQKVFDHFSLWLKVPDPYVYYGSSTSCPTVCQSAPNTMGHTFFLKPPQSQFTSSCTEVYTQNRVRLKQFSLTKCLLHKLEHRRYARGAVLRPHGPGSIVLSFFSTLRFVAGEDDSTLSWHYTTCLLSHKSEAIHTTLTLTVYNKTVFTN